jgi:hypothetical protein
MQQENRQKWRDHGALFAEGLVDRRAGGGGSPLAFRPGAIKSKMRGMRNSVCRQIKARFREQRSFNRLCVRMINFKISQLEASKLSDARRKHKSHFVAA